MSRVIPGFHVAERVARMKYRPLGNTGVETSILSLGGSAFSKIYGDFNEHEGIDLVHNAIKSGINYIDTAPWYGQGNSEKFLGKALRGIPREAYTIATKVGRYELEPTKMFDYRPQRLQSSIAESLANLGLEYVDLLQVHDVEFAPNPMTAPDVSYVCEVVLPAMQEIKRSGLCRFVGITGYSLDVLRDIVTRSADQIDTVLSYSRLTLNDSSLLEHLSWFQEKGIPLINASPVSMGLLTRGGPQPWHPAPEPIKKACSEAVQYCNGQGVDIAKLAFHYSYGFPQVSTTLTSVLNNEQLEKNLSWVHSGLTEQEQAVQDHIVKEFFEPLPVKHWDGIELEEYKKNMDKAFKL